MSSIENIVNYDSPLVRFKKDLWSLCVSMKIFHDIPENNLEKTKNIFENIVSNYKTQILQQQGQENENILKQTLLTQINKQLQILKEVSKENIQKNKQNQFDNQLEEKQKEFNSLMKKDIPPEPKFSDNNLDEPIDSSNLDKMIENQIKERENVLQINSQNNVDENKVISNNSFTIPPQLPLNQQNIDIQNIDIQNIQLSLKQLQENVKIQSNILQQILQSQIIILNKIK